MNSDYTINKKGEISGFYFQVPKTQEVSCVKNALYYLGLKCISVDCVRKAKAGEYDPVKEEDYEKALECINLLTSLWLNGEAIDEEVIDKLVKHEYNYDTSQLNVKNKNILSLLHNALNVLLLLTDYVEE